MINVNISKKVFNDAYLPYLDSWIRLELFYGGGGSGKSFFLAERDIVRCMSIKGYNVLVVRKFASAHHDTDFADYCSVILSWKLSGLFHIINSKGSERIVCQNGNEIIFAGCRNQIELEKLKGIKTKTGPIVHIRMEEATEFTLQDFLQLNNVRLRGQSKIPKQMTLSFNGVAQGAWVKKMFFDQPRDKTVFFEHENTDPKKFKDAEVVVLKTTHVDNRFYGEEERKQLLALEQMDKYYYDVYVLGNWGVLGNVVFKNYVIHDFEEDQNSLENVFHGMDFGFVHAQAIESAGFKNGELYVFDELWEKGRTNPEFIADAENYFGDRLYAMEMTADSANPDKIAEWNQKGYRVNPAKKGDGSLRYGIEFLIGLKIHIHATKCPNLAREIQGFKRREDKDGNSLESFVELNDDGIAALRYGSEWLWAQTHAAISDWSASDLGL